MFVKKGNGFGVFFVILLLCIILLPVQAEDRDFTLDAGDINYDYREKKIYASNNVVFISPDFKISCSELVVDINKTLVVAEGDNVILDNQGIELKGKHLEYDYQSLTGKFYGVKGKIGENRFKGKVIELVEDRDYEYLINEASFTPCILDKPHYQYRVGKIEVYSGGRIVGHNVQFWWGELKLFALPYYVLNYEQSTAGEGEFANPFPLKEIDYNTDKGIFMEFLYPYELNEKSGGKLAIDLAQRGDRKYLLTNNTQIKQNLLLQSKYEYDKVIAEKEDEENQLELDEVLSTVLTYRMNDKLTFENMLKYDRELEDGVEEKYGIAATGFTYSLNDYLDIPGKYEYRKNLDTDQIKETVSTGIYYKKGKLDLKTDFSRELLAGEREEEIELDYQITEENSFNFYHDYINEELEKQSYKLVNRASPVKIEAIYREGYDTDYLPYYRLIFPDYLNISSSFGIGRVRADGLTVNRAKVAVKYSNSIKLTDNLRIDFSEGYVSHIYHLDNPDYYQVFTTGVKGKYSTDINERLSLETSLGWEQTATKGDYLFSDDEVEEDKVIDTGLKIKLKTPEPRSAWVFANNNRYSLREEDWEDIGLEITRQHDCYSISIGYDFVDKTYNYGINF